MQVFPREVPFREIFRRFWPYVARRRRWFALGLLISLIPPAIETAEIWMFKILVDDVLIPRQFGLFPAVAGIYIALTLLGCAVSGASRMLSTWLSQRFLIELRIDLLRHLQTLSPTFFNRNRLGDLLTRMSGDVAAIETFVLSALSSFVKASLTVIFFVGALFILQWKLAIVALIVTPFFWFIARRFSKRIKVLSREKQRLSGAIGSVVEQTLSNVSLVQAYGQQERQISRYRREVESRYRADMSTARLKSLYTPVVELIELAGVLTVIGAGVWLLMRGELSIGGLLAFLTYLGSLYSPIRRLGTLANSAYAASAGAERVIEVLDEQPLVCDSADARELERATGRVEVQDVSFAYPNTVS